MKHFILSLVTMLTVTVSASAQFQGGEGQRPRFNREEMIKSRTEMMVKKYGLDADQAAKLQTLNEKQMPQMRGMRNAQKHEKADSTAQRPRREGKMRDEQGQRHERGQRMGAFNMKAYNEELEKIMTPEQYKAYQEDMQKMSNRLHSGQDRRRNSRSGGEASQE